MGSISRDVTEPLLRFCVSADTPICLGVYLRVKYECWDELAIMSVSPSDYMNAYDYFIDRQAACWLSKYESLPTSFDKKWAAYASLIASEDSCRATNKRFSDYLTGNTTLPEKVFDAIQRIQKFIIDVIGLEPPAPRFHFGPGATLSDETGLTSIPHKQCSTISVTSTALWLIPEWSQTAWGRYCQKEIEIVDCHRFTYASKKC